MSGYLVFQDGRRTRGDITVTMDILLLLRGMVHPMARNLGVSQLILSRFPRLYSLCVVLTRFRVSWGCHRLWN